MGRTACTDSQCLYSTALPLLPLWAYGLYRASVPVQYSYTSTPPMGLRPVQSLSACTVELYLYSPYGPTACTEPQCLYSTAIHLLPLWAARPVQILSACTVQLYLYSPYGPTACTEPQCLYSRAILLLRLWAVRPLQSLSACTVGLYLYSPYGPYGLYRASVPVQ